MNLIKCPNGHFYDASKFQQCPHCSAVQNNDVTVPLNPQSDMETVAIDDAQDAKTVPIQPQTPPATVTPVISSPVTPPPVAAVPIAPAFPIPGTEPEIAQAETNDDDVATIAYYDIERVSAAADDGDPAADKHSRRPSRIDPVVGWLVIVNGEERGKSVQLKVGRNFIGRASTNDIAISGDKKISREKHAIIVFEPRSQTFLVQPGTSKSLFYVNDQVILDTKVINAYDVINIGETNLVFIPFCGESFSWDTDEDDA